MLTNEREGNRVKCAKYWPSGEEQDLQQGPYIVRLTAEDVFANYTIRSIELVVCITKYYTCTYYVLVVSPAGFL